MLKQSFTVLIIILLNLFLANGVSVDIDADVYRSHTEFRYVISFDESEDFDSFSFEKPRSSSVISVTSEDSNPIDYVIAGDFYIIKPQDDTSGKNITIIFRSVSVSNGIELTNSYSNYINFNFDIDTLTYEVDFKEDFGEMVDVFPREYVISSTGTVNWVLNNVSNDRLFLITFSPAEEKTSYTLYIILGVIIIILLVIILFFVSAYLRKKNSNRNPADKIQQHSVEEHNPGSEPEPSVEEKFTHKQDEKINEDRYEEITKKYLTENEKEVVTVVRNHEGISQYDILNFLPTLTKSNLSKIITKLHSKKILNRIRVGKVNKLYLGDRFKQDSSNSEK